MLPVLPHILSLYSAILPPLKMQDCEQMQKQNDMLDLQKGWEYMEIWTSHWHVASDVS